MSDYSPTIETLDTAGFPEIRVTRFASLLLPSLGTAVFSITLLHVLFLSEGTRTLFRDSDTGWHIRNGEAILRQAAVPRSDNFSYTREGRPWFAWEWLSDALLGGAHRIAGLAGVALLAAVAIALAAWGAARLSLSLGGDFFLTACSTILLLGTTSIHWLARPHVFSWCMSLIFLAAAERERRRPGRGPFWLSLPACLWANLHGSFLLGPALLFLYAVGEWLGGRRISGHRFAGAGLVSFLATFINPYGWRLHEHVASYLADGYLMDHIAEFRSFSFHSPGALYVELFLFAAVLGAAALARQRAFGPALLAAALIHMSLYSARHFPTAAVLLLPLCVPALTEELRAWPRLRPMLAYSERLNRIDRKVLGALPVILVLACIPAGLGAAARAGRVGFSPVKFPVQAADFLERHGQEMRIFTKDQWGGYLIYRFSGRTKVFLDGRSDFYGREMLETYASVAEVRPGWDRVLRQFDVRLALIPPDHALATALGLSPQWKRIYADPIAALFERVG